MSFKISVEFIGGLTVSQQAAFASAAARWEEIITGELPRVQFRGTTIDGLVITAQGVRIDGTGDPVTGRNVLGQAAPLVFRPISQLPALGFMQFDSADLFNLEFNDQLEDVILHEMGHVLGIGTLWGRLSLLQNAGGVDPVFVGQAAMREFANLIGESSPTPVPVANAGVVGGGSRDSHWREESLLENELMSPSLNRGVENPLSRLTIASLADLGYEVNFDAADAFQEIAQANLASSKASQGTEIRFCSMCGRLHKLPQPIILSEDTLLD